MPKKSARKLESLTKFFTRVGGIVVGMGEKAQQVGAAVKISKPPREKKEDVSRRLQEIKRLEGMREEELKDEKKLISDKKFEERAELRQPLSERLSSLFYTPLKRPATRLAKFFKGMDADLYRANIRTTPERYAAMMVGVSSIVAVFAVVMMFLLRLPLLLIPLGGVVMFLFSLVFIRTQPKRRAKARAGDINRLIPYALRHMATQLSSGIGLPETMTSVSRAGYGAMSEEFDKAIRDMHAGMSMEEALTSMDRRVESEPLRRATRQVQRTLRTGGDLAKTLNTLADETAFEMHMKLRDYTQSLNMLTMIYMFASAVIPAMMMVVIMISAGKGGAGITPQTAAVLYLILIPFMLVYFVMMIKRFEPRL